MMVSTAVNPETNKAARVATTRIVLIVEYDGTHYHGLQWQAGLPTIQKELETALKKLTGDSIRVIAASRTDAGVHARGQVVSFRTKSTLPPPKFVSGLNYYLPPDIAVREAHRADDSFRARGGALSREYNYYILNSPTRSPLQSRFVHLVTGHLDIDAMNQASQALIGRHDLISFASSIGGSPKNTVRQVYQAGVKREGELVIFHIEANSFLPHQVRNTVGCLIRIGLGRMSQDEFHSIIESGKPGLAGPTAPAHGLCLMRVNYPHNLAGK